MSQFPTSAAPALAALATVARISPDHQELLTEQRDRSDPVTRLRIPLYDSARMQQRARWHEYILLLGALRDHGTCIRRVLKATQSLPTHRKSIMFVGNRSAGRSVIHHGAVSMQ
jgi:hypothetical protein